MGAEFGRGSVAFDHATLGEGSLSFVGASLPEGEMSFLDTHIVGYLSFQDAVGEQTALRIENCIFRGYDNLRFAKLHSLRIQDCIIDGTILMDDTEKTTVEIDQLSFRGTKNLGSIYLSWPKARRAIAAEPIDNKKQKASQMKLLKENFHKAGAYIAEDQAFVCYMRYTRQASSSVWVRFGHRLIDVVGCYGTNPFRIFLTMLVVMVLWGFFYTDLVPFTAISPKEQFSESSLHLSEAVYFSAVTFLTIGYGDVYPLNEATAILAGFEGGLGVFLMSYFVVSIVRKTLR